MNKTAFTILFIILSVIGIGKAVAVNSMFQQIKPGISVGNLTADPAGHRKGDFYFNSTSNTFRGYDGTSWGSVGGGANTALSNLSSTAINAALVPGANNSIGLGDGTHQWASLETVGINFYDSSNNQYGSIFGTAGTTTPAGHGTRFAITNTNNNSSGNNAIGIFTSNFSGNTRNLYLETGNAANGIGGAINIQTGTSNGGSPSGGINLQTGTSDGTRGAITILDGSEGTSGYVWKSVDTVGTGHWGRALTSLNAQTGLTQVFANDTNVIVTSSNNTHTLGWASTLSFARGGTAANLTPVNGGVVYSGAAALAISAAGTAGEILQSNGAGAPTWIPASGVTPIVPHITTYTSGSGLFSTNGSTVYIKVRLVGGGGGGGTGSGGTGGGGGTGSSLSGASATITGNGGSGGANDSAGGAGGSASITGSASGVTFPGTAGQGSALDGTGADVMGSQGGGTPFASGGAGGAYGASGMSGATNSGAGGGGGGGVASAGTGSGGGSGGYAEAFITTPDSSYTYSVGASGSAGSGAIPGGGGAAGIIIIEEYY